MQARNSTNGRSSPTVMSLKNSGTKMSGYRSRGFLSAWTALFLLATMAVPARAGPLEDAKAAHERGDDDTAVRLIRPLADQGNAIAEFDLGMMYDAGLGVPLDHAEAAQWYRRAAEK